MKAEPITIKAAYTVGEVAEILGQGITATRNLVMRGTIPSYQIPSRAAAPKTSAIRNRADWLAYKRKSRAIAPHWWLVPYGALREYCQGNPRYRAIARKLGA